ncbi:uncharacterized protein MICPUCDRAFT_52880 [Micromonas pusilla CCMP1545]|uniref:Predicted protein n=1 Tax=Micromonas pusilla (strain CCMP1545) TaxID=564608 RepID=C1N5B4_MICPC|nr:uncharacterized protein MICPUCDRAFT_52880 [Micromonas pusilla CCMP1545]EEH52876.1 predicted protein [Micromonas pusilla CCMP1545]|eukprot:XP_003062937.1 predicted protein [Micromonas pusilla CCMP1545]
MVLSNAIRAATRGVRTSSAAAMSLPALTTPAAGKPSILGAIFGGATPPAAPPMDTPLPGLAIPDPPPHPATAPTTHVTVLSNGATIASEDAPGASLAVGLYVGAGSKHEIPGYTTGAAHLLERCAFRATANRSTFRLTREAEAVELLADAALNPKFADHEVDAVAAQLKKEMQEMAKDPSALIMEALHATAFEGGLGQPLVASPAALSRLNAAALKDFVADNYVAPRLVLAAAGCAHAELVSLAEPLLSSLPKAKGQPSIPSRYVGGDYRVGGDAPATHVVLAFECAGGWKDHKSATAMTVFNTLMGGGGSFSAGGPGKGMYSRLYTRVLNKHHWAQNCTAFHSVFDDVGVVGVSGVADAGKASEMAAVMAREMLAVASGGVTEEELERAKAATISSILMNLESKAIVAEDVGRQILTYSERKPPGEFIAQIRALTVKDMTEFAKGAIKSAPTLCQAGDLSSAPRYDKVKAMFN